MCAAPSPPPAETDRPTYKEIATKLLNDKRLLTALELHAELLHAGTSLPPLASYFSNPANFEPGPAALPRSDSQATLDSLDLARYSEDGAAADERIAVLEFELRKARETIAALRSTLTHAAAAPGAPAAAAGRPHEQRALNFLVHEYLLQSGHRLTSVTFADENQRQDFDDWEDVGLDGPRPPPLLGLYRAGHAPAGSRATQTDRAEPDAQAAVVAGQSKQILALQDEVALLRGEKFEMVKKQAGGTPPGDDLSNNSLNTSDWTNLTSESGLEGAPPVVDYFPGDLYGRSVFSRCYLQLEGGDGADEGESFVQVVTQALLKVIPSILLVRREEVIPMLVGAVRLNREVGERDRLLQQLFNLKKRPNAGERKAILGGIVRVVKGSNEALVENEILPQCWEQMTYKYVEKKMLVVEACTILIPYVSSQIRNSLILSILQQMLDDRDETVRSGVIRALSLIVVLCEDDDKYQQCQEIVLNTLNDSNQEIIDLSVELLVPVLAKWALDNANLRKSLLKQLLQVLNEDVREQQLSNKATHKTINTINALKQTLPFFLVATIDSCNLTDNNETKTECSRDFTTICTNLTNPLLFYKDFSAHLAEFDQLVEIPETEAITWLLEIMIPDLINNLNQIVMNPTIIQAFLNLFTSIALLFGPHFTHTKIRPIISTHIHTIDELLPNYQQFNPPLNTIPLYLIILTFSRTNDLFLNLKKYISILPTCGAPLEPLSLSITALMALRHEHVLVNALWEGVTHQRPLVRAATANLFNHLLAATSSSAISRQISPALVTLANDSDVFVKTASVPALGVLLLRHLNDNICDKVELQLEALNAEAAMRLNHQLQRQLVVTFGAILVRCNERFRRVIIVELCRVAMELGDGGAQRVDMALALVETFAILVYEVGAGGERVLEALRGLEAVVGESGGLGECREAVGGMVREVEGRRGSRGAGERGGGEEEMRARVSRMFVAKSNSFGNLQGIFKKK